jgi:hypothetical protein
MPGSPPRRRAARPQPGRRHVRAGIGIIPRFVPILATAADLQAFYQAIATVSFLLLGFWWPVGRSAPAGPAARHAYGVSMYFFLPGLMSLMASVNSELTTLWRVAFALTGVVGALEVILYLRAGLRGGHSQLALRALGSVDYLLIVIVALVPTLTMDLGLGLKPREVEAVLLTIMLLIGSNIAWLSMRELEEAAQRA